MKKISKAGKNSKSAVFEEEEMDSTPEITASDSWKSGIVFDRPEVLLNRGHLHPLLKFRTEFRQIFLEMGFTEVPLNNYVESSFWCYDALFVPQHDPGRGVLATAISDPATSKDLPKKHMEAVRKIHSEGDYGSTGYNDDWKAEVAKKNVLRTHTMPAMTRILAELKNERPFRPVKWFGIDRCFRFDDLDATHLTEFHQVEGLMADYMLTLADIKGIIVHIFKKLGIENIRCKGTFNRFSTPSMDVAGYHPGLKKWIEVGNSGVYRPEVTRPLGIPQDITVVGWGLSLERNMMIKYGIDSIQDLFGNNGSLQMTYDFPIVRLDSPS